MLIKLILNRTNNPYVQLFKSAVTVASPFYGCGGQLPHYFIGDPDLNPLYGNRTVTRIISSLAAGYTLLFLDQNTYQRDGAKLMQDPHYPLLRYPILDTINGTPADPYNPQTYGAKVRYPQLYGFDWGMPVVARRYTTRLPLCSIPQSTQNSSTSAGSPPRTAPTSTRPSRIRPGAGSIPILIREDETNCPITDYLGPGDGDAASLVNAVCARAAANVRTLRGDQIDHMFMMNNTQVLNELSTVI